MAETTVLEKSPAQVESTPGGLNKEPASLVRIRFQDCDPFGHLNNARYLDYFINAREEHLREHYDFDLYAGEFRKRNWVVRSSMVSHLRPAVNNQIVRIQTRLAGHTHNSILVEAVMTDAAQGSLLAVSWADFRHIDLTNGRPVRHSEALMELFGSLDMGVDFAFGAEKNRINQIKANLKAQQKSSGDAI